mmetsp:Transcript_20903/g.45200  ORF Transcript_20903/g.45200 Transcript_20903/m.45200 type:complete len:193 (+) Transcript_20903:65-643(+)
MRCLITVAALLAGLFQSTVLSQAFLSSQSRRGPRWCPATRSPSTTRIQFSTSTPETEADMKALIVSLSNEPTDELRRKRMETVIADGLAQSDDEERQQFCALFQQALEAVGNEVQAEARELAMKRYEETEQEAETSSDGEDSAIRIETVSESGGKIKSPVETQLWALVDMMVQSKTMMKRAAGKLGNKGEFQ